MPTLVLTPAAARDGASRPRPGLAGALLRLAAWPLRYWRARQDLAVLGSLTDHELRDIGLMRTDIANVTALPRDADPTLELAKLVEDRRRHRH